MFVLAHLSDPHLGPLARPHPFELANKRILGFVNWHRHRKTVHLPETVAALVTDLRAQQLDHIAVTGDLVNIALPSEFAPARVFLESLGAPHDVTLVPGNHDSYVRAAAVHAQRHWGDYMHGDQEGGFPFVRRRGPVALIGLSTAVPTRPFMATGTLGFEQLRRLGEILDRLDGEDVFRVVMLHHPPVSAPHRQRERLMDADAFRDVLQKHGAELVLHGHDHIHSVVWLDGKTGFIPAIGVPSASSIATKRHDPAAYNIYRIDGQKGAWRCQMITRGFQRGQKAEDGVSEIGRHFLNEL